MALVTEHALSGPLLDLITAVLAMGDEVLARLTGIASRYAGLCKHLGLQIPQAGTSDLRAGGGPPISAQVMGSATGMPIGRSIRRSTSAPRMARWCERKLF
jgi:hypothetical protein